MLAVPPLGHHSVWLYYEYRQLENGAQLCCSVSPMLSTEGHA